MKKTIAFLVFLVVGTSVIYISLHRTEPEYPLQRPNTTVKELNKATQSALKKQSEPAVTPVRVKQETKHIDVTEQQSNFDWRDNAPSDSPVPKRSDPFGDFIAEQKSKEDGTFIGDPETMDRSELRSAIYKQMLKQFGDIPAVHTLMEFERKWDENIPMTLEEEIEGLEANMQLYPSESVKKTIIFNKWLISKGATIVTDNYDLTTDDIIYLQSEGISVETELTDDGNFQTTISTR